MKTVYFTSVLAAAIALLVLSVPVHASKKDSSIELSAKQTHVFKTYLKNDDISIQSIDGVVTLRGNVSEYFHKSLAQETVAALPDVKSVDNRLAVKGAPPTASSDAGIRDRLKVALLFHRRVSTGTKVEVKHGIVTLRGNAASKAQKELTTEYARNVEGVRDVTNKMTVKKTSKKPRTADETIDDASITAQVKITLLYHRSASTLVTKVETKHGEVTVYGKARNGAELKLVTKLANDLGGVKSVKNMMTIE